MTIMKNERGIALVLVLILALIGLAIVSSLLYMVTSGTRQSGAEKFYRSADEAALGGARIGVDLITNNFDNAMAGGALSAPFAATLGTQIFNNACLMQKLSLAPGASFANWTSCAAANMRSLDIISTDNTTFDMRFTLNGVPNNYNVFAKVVDTVEGNTAGVASGGAAGGGAAGTGAGGGLFTGGVGGGGASIVTPPRRSWMYRIEVQAQDSVNPQERSRYTVLYAH